MKHETAINRELFLRDFIRIGGMLRLASHAIAPSFGFGSVRV
jgi:hypothetical protein